MRCAPPAVAWKAHFRPISFLSCQSVAGAAEGRARGPLYHVRMACRRLMSVRAAAAGCVAAACLAAAAAAVAATPAIASDPSWWAPNARLLKQTALPSRPVAARFVSGLVGWTLLGPGAVTLRAGGPGGHYAALRDNTTLETPPLAIGRTQQVVLISARAPVGSPLLHISAVTPTAPRTCSAISGPRRAGTRSRSTPRVSAARRCGSCSIR